MESLNRCKPDYHTSSCQFKAGGSERKKAVREREYLKLGNVKKKEAEVESALSISWSWHTRPK